MGLGDKVSQTLKGVFDPLVDLFLWPIQKGLEWGLETFFDLLGKRLAPRIRPLIDKIEATGKVPPEMQPFLDEMKSPSGEIAALLSYSAARGGLGMVTGGFLATLTSGVDAGLKAAIQPSLLDPRSIIDAERREAASEGFTNQEWLWTGFNTIRRDILRDVTRPLLDVDTLRQLYFRFPAQERVVDDVLRSYGFRDLDISALKQIWQVIPGPADQVRFAVREAFDPATISKYNLGAFFPTAFGEEVAKVGLGIDWAKRYWYSHWILPSTGQGFEMLQRNVINKDTLLDLMRYADILPFWHQKLIDIAYSPLTRVDVRRMHAFLPPGSIDLVRRYQDLGFDKDNAKLMADFTIAYNQAANRELSRSDITDGYKRGLLAQGEALEDLAALGYDADEIDFYLTREDLKKEESVKSDYSARYKKLYVKNLIDEVTMRTEMVPLGFSDGEIGELVRLWDIEKRSQKETTFEAKERDLNRADVTDGYRRDILNPTEARDLLDKLGYDADEIDFYLTREDYKRDAALAQDLVTAYRRQYLTGVIDEGQARAALVAIPLPPEQITHLVALWALDKESQEWSPVVPQERDLSRADILDAYRKRVISPEDAPKMLAALGYDASEIDLLITKTDYESEKEKKLLSLSTYKSLYTSGLLDKTSTTAALADLGYEEQEIEYLYELWDIEAVGNLKLPTKAELTRFLKKDIINLATWRTLLADMGYPDQVIKWYEEDMEE